MAILQVIGSGPGVGKTSLISALALSLLEEGRRVGYYKPFSSSPDDDRYTSFVYETLLDRAPPLNSPHPLPAPHDGPGGALPAGTAEGIRAAIADISSDADVILVDGPDLPLIQALGPATGQGLAPEAGARTLLVSGYEAGMEAASIARMAEAFGETLAGVVINGFLRHRSREVTQGLVGELRSRGVPVLGAIPEERAMLSVTVRQIADYLGGRWLQGPEDTEAWVDRFLIGGNIMDSGPNYFGRYSNQAVITRAERPDIQLASLMCDTQCLVLTGGAEPTEYIKSEAFKKDVPIVLVSEDTLTTAESLGGLLSVANPHSRHKATHFAQCVRQHLDLDALQSALT